MKLSIIIPVYNEKNTILEILKRVSATKFDKEIIIVDDFSFDGTKEILKELSIKDVKIFYHARNTGKGGAVKTGISHVTGDIVVIQDADLEYDPQEYSKLIKPILDDKADVVYGSRFVGSEAHRILFFWHMLGNKFLTLFSNMLSNLNLTDMETGYKIFKSDIIKRLTLVEDRFGFEPEITAKIAKLNIRIYEIGISYCGRKYEEGKKIGWKDGVHALKCIIKYNLFS